MNAFGMVAASLAAVLFAGLAWVKRRDRFYRVGFAAFAVLFVAEAALRAGGVPWWLAELPVWLLIAFLLAYSFALRRQSRRLRRETATLRARNEETAGEIAALLEKGPGTGPLSR